MDARRCSPSTGCIRATSCGRCSCAKAQDCEEPIASLPGVSRWSVDRLAGKAKEAAALGIPCVALFPNTPEALRTDDAGEALNPDNLICRAIRAIKDAVPEIGVLTDVALDPYTSPRPRRADRRAAAMSINDDTVAILAEQALVQAAAGADIVAPSDMMDGRVGAIRAALEARRPSRRRDHGLCGQICVGLLRAVPRRGRLGRRG